MDTNIGKIFKERYEIIGELSHGGSSHIYVGQDLTLNRKIIIKIFLPQIFSSIKNEDLFLNEVQITSRLVHKNIVKIFDFFKFQNKLCLILEYVQGPTLRDLIDQNQEFNEKKIANIFEQLLTAVEFAHSKNIVHRDLKPENIIILQNNKVKILDFGISIDRTYLTQKAELQLIGSAKYIAPEVVANQIYTVQSDIYSIGIILYEVLLGQPPFDNESLVLLMKKHLYERIIRVREYNRNISQQMENIVILATAKNPEERYISIEQMIVDFNYLLVIHDQPKPIFLKNEIYRGEISNQILIDESSKSINAFWLEKRFFFLLSIFLLTLFLFFLVIVVFLYSKQIN